MPNTERGFKQGRIFKINNKSTYLFPYLSIEQSIH